MISKLSVFLIVLLSSGNAVAASSAIGTANARGDMRIDGNPVMGNATLFDGTVVETGQATAALHLNRGVEIKLATGSRSTLYRDRIVLRQGASEFAPSSAFSVEANGLQVTSDESNSRGVISMSGPKTIEVAALAGAFRVTNGQGLVIAKVRPGKAMSFAMLAETPGNGLIAIEGQLTKVDGNYYLTDSTNNTRYAVSGQKFGSLVNAEVKITGTLSSVTTSTGAAVPTILVSTMTRVAVSGVSAGIATGPSFIIVGSAAAVGTGVGLGVSAATQDSKPASR